ncbi:hypothetical protein BKA61DRAFT_674160 [Leptodontidium sp. MPI-SDFR-AT-0119]|nr:hypothetical protein BKA61DRAFT_674160 [Leptodontidium sp. MPI-SDFR-AT-0119]
MYPQISKSILMAFTTLIISTTALPTETTTFYPEVIPGPGMPSLAELGLTSEQLYTTTPNLPFGNSFTTLYNGECRHCPDALANVDSVIACFNYLMSLGTSGCGVDRYNGKRFCTSGNAKVDGLNYTPGQANPTKSYCSDVALAVQWIFNHCNSGGQVRGSQAANGNGELVIRAQHVNYDGWC